LNEDERRLFFIAFAYYSRAGCNSMK